MKTHKSIFFLYISFFQFSFLASEREKRKIHELINKERFLDLEREKFLDLEKEKLKISDKINNFLFKKQAKYLNKLIAKGKDEALLLTIYSLKSYNKTLFCNEFEKKNLLEYLKYDLRTFNLSAFKLWGFQLFNIFSYSSPEEMKKLWLKIEKLVSEIEKKLLNKKEKILQKLSEKQKKLFELQEENYFYENLVKLKNFIFLLLKQR